MLPNARHTRALLAPPISTASPRSFATNPQAMERLKPLASTFFLQLLISPALAQGEKPHEPRNEVSGAADIGRAR